MAKENGKTAADAAKAAGSGKGDVSKPGAKSGGKVTSESKAAAKKQPGKPQVEAKVGLQERVGQLKEYFEESKVELKKVTWPSRKETVSTCIAVIVLTIVMSIYLGVLDLGLSKIVALILS